MRASASLFFPELRPREGWPEHSSRLKLATMVGIGWIALGELVVIVLLKGFSYWAWMASHGISRTTAMVVLVASLAIIPVTGILVYGAIERFGPDARVAGIENLFTVFHWATFIALLAIAIPWLRSGDVDGLLSLSIAFAIIPLRIGRLRPLGVLLIAIVSALVFAMRPDSRAAAVMACCTFAYVAFPWLEAARISAQSARLVHRPL